MRQLITIILSFQVMIMAGQPCTDQFTGYTPIADLGMQAFNGYTGGKYPDGSNKIPAAHFEAGMQAGAAITPRDSMGNTDTANGRIGFLVLGYSTAAMTGRTFRDLMSIQQPGSSIDVIIGAQGGRDINAMTDTLGSYWKIVDSSIQASALSSRQVQVIWISTGDIRLYTLPFPDQAQMQISKYQKVLHIIAERYPNAAIVFISDRPFAGYIGTGEPPGPKELAEPSAYYHGWAVKWLIEKQIRQEPGYGTDTMPFIDWGPSLWTNGSKGDKQGYTWDCDDAGKGGIHPTSKGRMKEAAKMFQYFSVHPYVQHLFE